MRRGHGIWAHHVADVLRHLRHDVPERLHTLTLIFPDTEPPTLWLGHFRLASGLRGKL